MTLWVLVTMLFGYLTSFAQKGDDFAVVMPLVLLAIAVPAIMSRRLARTVAVFALLAMGFAAFVIATHMGLRFADGMGPRVIETPLVIAALWTAVMLAALTVARAMAVRYRRGIVVVVVLTVAVALLISLTIEPALFALGLTAYAGRGLYFGIPFAQQLMWIVSAVAAGLAGFVLFGDEDALGAPSLDSGMLLLALATGVNIAHQLWLPSVLGLLLLQYGFSLRRTV